MQMKMNVFDWIALTLLVIGGLNWGLVGIFEFDLVAEIFGTGATISRIIYTLVGASAAYMVAAAIARAPSMMTSGQAPKGQTPTRAGA